MDGDLAGDSEDQGAKDNIFIIVTTELGAINQSRINTHAAFLLLVLRIEHFMFH